MRNLVLLVVVIFATTHTLEAAYPKIINYQKRDYGTGARNWDFAQTAGGCIYVANSAGPVEFDGSHWENYYMPNGTTVRSLLHVESESGSRLYSGAFDEFGYWEEGVDGRMRYHSMKPLFDGAETMTEFWDIHAIGPSIFFRTERNIFRYSDGKADVLNRGGDHIDCSASLYNSLVISTPGDGPMVLCGDMFVPMPGARRLAGKKICAMLPWRDGRILFVTDIHGLWIYDGRDIAKYDTPWDGELCENQIFCATATDSTLALGTVRGGLYLFDATDGRGVHLDRASGLQNNTVLSLFFDVDSNLWLGLDNGIDHLILDLPDRRMFSKNTDPGSGYCSLVFGGKLYLGTNQGLFCAGYTPGSGEPGPFAPLGRGAGAVAQVWNLAEIDGRLFCSHDHGLLVVEANGATTHIDRVTGVWKVMPLRERADVILGCSYQGLFVLEKRDDAWRFSHNIEGWNESSGVIEEDADGKIWFSHWRKGLYRLTLDGDMRRVVKAEYFGVERGFPTERNNIPYRVGGRIVFSSEGGFFLYDHRQGRMIREESLNALFIDHSPVSLRIHDLGQGDILFTSWRFCGVAFGDGAGGYTLDSLSLHHLAENLIVGFDHHSMLGDKLLVSNEEGFSLVDVARMRSRGGERSTHGVFVKSLRSGGRSENPIYGERGGEGRGGIVPDIPYRDNSLRIELCSPEYHYPDAVEYSVMLEGYDEGWSSFSKSNVKEYTRLREGQYTLRVRSRNNFTQTTSEGRLDFAVLPPWYRSGAALVIYALLGVVLLWFLQRLVTKHSNLRVNAVKRQKEREMREQQNLWEETTREKEKELILMQNRVMEQDLRNKSNDLASSTLNIIRKNEILMQIENDLTKALPNIEAGNTASAMSILKKLRRDIHENMEHDSYWGKFEHNFDKVHENFLKRLGSTFPQLNLNDKRLCAYLRMDLQSKEIAPLMNISVRSVEMARYRLRKKMGLGRDINLSEYLQKF